MESTVSDAGSSSYAALPALPGNYSWLELETNCEAAGLQLAVSAWWKGSPGRNAKSLRSTRREDVWLRRAVDGGLLGRARERLQRSGIPERVLRSGLELGRHLAEDEDVVTAWSAQQGLTQKRMLKSCSSSMFSTCSSRTSTSISRSPFSGEIVDLVHNRYRVLLPPLGASVRLLPRIKQRAPQTAESEQKSENWEVASKADSEEEDEDDDGLAELEAVNDLNELPVPSAPMQFLNKADRRTSFFHDFDAVSRLAGAQETPAGADGGVKIHSTARKSILALVSGENSGVPVNPNVRMSLLAIASGNAQALASGDASTIPEADGTDGRSSQASLGEHAVELPALPAPTSKISAPVAPKPEKISPKVRASMTKRHSKERMSITKPRLTSSNSRFRKSTRVIRTSAVSHFDSWLKNKRPGRDEQRPSVTSRIQSGEKRPSGIGMPESSKIKQNLSSLYKQSASKIKQNATKDLSEIRLVFDEFDDDSSGELDPSEFIPLLAKLLNQRVTDLNKEEVWKIWDSVDEDGSGSISFDEFAKWYSGLLGGDLIQNKRSFLTADMIASAEDKMLIRLARQLNMPIVQLEDLHKKFHELDTDGSDSLEFPEFSVLLQQYFPEDGLQEKHSAFKIFWAELEGASTGSVSFPSFAQWFMNFKHGDRTPMEQFYALVGDRGRR